jgi:hypothetical protein
MTDENRRDDEPEDQSLSMPKDADDELLLTEEEHDGWSEIRLRPSRTELERAS